MRFLAIVALVFLPLLAESQPVDDFSGYWVYGTVGKSLTSWHGQHP